MEGKKSIEERIAALEKEQLSIKKYLKEDIKSNEELIEIIKTFCNDIKESETVNTDAAKLLS